MTVAANLLLSEKWSCPVAGLGKAVEVFRGTVVRLWVSFNGVVCTLVPFRCCKAALALMLSDAVAPSDVVRA